MPFMQFESQAERVIVSILSAVGAGIIGAAIVLTLGSLFAAWFAAVIG